jgi:hypothetical protein
MDVDYTGEHIVLVYQFTNTNNAYAAYSSDNGTSFTVLTGVTHPCASVAIDSTGSSIAAASTNGYVYVSTNYGQTFTAHHVYETNVDLAIAASTFSGNKYLYAMKQTSPATMMISKDYGMNWTAQTVDKTFFGSVSFLPIAASGSGSGVVMGVAAELISSQTFGRNWTVALQGFVEINRVAISGDGQNIYLGTIDGIYIYHNGKKQHNAILFKLEFAF